MSVIIWLTRGKGSSSVLYYAQMRCKIIALLEETDYRSFSTILADSLAGTWVCMLSHIVGIIHFVLLSFVTGRKDFCFLSCSTVSVKLESWEMQVQALSRDVIFFHCNYKYGVKFPVLD